MDLPLIVSTAKSTLERLSERLHGSVSSSAVADFVRLSQPLGPFDDYKVFPQAARVLVPTSQLADGAEASAVFLKAAIMQALVDTVASERFGQLPARVRTQQLGQMQRMVSDSDSTPEWLQIDHDIFYKEFGIASLRLYVAGAQVVDYRCGIPRSILIAGGLANLPKNLAAILRLGGFRKYFQIHTHKLMLDAFNEEGWDECYRCCAELYPLHPEVLGMYGSSWFYDPALDNISPRLRYLRTTPLAGGAELFFIEEGGSARNSSLATSPTRRKLYEEGKYFPKNYMLAWGRSKQIAWAKSYSGSSGVTDETQTFTH